MTLPALLFVGAVESLSAQNGTFAIWKGDDRVGSLLVDRTYQGDRTLYAMTSLSEVVVVLWTQEIRTSVSTEYLGGRLEACRSSVHVNDALRDSSSMRVQRGIMQGYVHPSQVLQGVYSNAWTTARMYYEEPVGQASIYVESVLRDCPLERIAGGTYRLVLPDDKVNQYVYRDGVLQEVQVDRPLFDLVFRRV